jgi:hypothetical protein
MVFRDDKLVVGLVNFIIDNSAINLVLLLLLVFFSNFVSTFFNFSFGIIWEDDWLLFLVLGIVSLEVLVSEVLLYYHDLDVLNVFGLSLSWRFRSGILFPLVWILGWLALVLWFIDILALWFYSLVDFLKWLTIYRVGSVLRFDRLLLESTRVHTHRIVLGLYSKVLLLVSWQVTQNLILWWFKELMVRSFSVALRGQLSSRSIWELNWVLDSRVDWNRHVIRIVIWHVHLPWEIQDRVLLLTDFIEWQFHFSSYNQMITVFDTHFGK